MGLDEALRVGPQEQLGALISHGEPALSAPHPWGHHEVERPAAWGRALTGQGVLQRLGVGHSGLQDCEEYISIVRKPPSLLCFVQAAGRD